MSKIILTLFLFALASADNRLDLNDVLGPDDITNYIVHRFTGNDGVKPNAWNEPPNESFKSALFQNVMHHLKLSNDLKFEANTSLSGSGTLNAKIHVAPGNKTMTSSISSDGASDLIYNYDRQDKEEAQCLVASGHSSMTNKLTNGSYTVHRNFSFGGGLSVRMLRREEALEFLSSQETDGPLNALHFLRASSKSKYHKSVQSTSYSDDMSKEASVTATVVLFDTQNCENSVGPRVECGTLGRVYHHIHSNMKRTYSYKGKGGSYATSNYGTIITVIKKA